MDVLWTRKFCSYHGLLSLKKKKKTKKKKNQGYHMGPLGSYRVYLLRAALNVNSENKIGKKKGEHIYAL